MEKLNPSLDFFNFLSTHHVRDERNKSWYSYSSKFLFGQVIFLIKSLLRLYFESETGWQRDKISINRVTVSVVCNAMLILSQTKRQDLRAWTAQQDLSRWERGVPSDQTRLTKPLEPSREEKISLPFLAISLSGNKRGTCNSCNLTGSIRQ